MQEARVSGKSAADDKIPAHYRVRNDNIDSVGTVTVRHRDGKTINELAGQVRHSSCDSRFVASTSRRRATSGWFVR
jgi:hypothetical protein